MAAQGKSEVTIKINELPAIASKDKNGWVTFNLDCGSRIAAIAGKLGQATDQGFMLEDMNIQVFKKRPKEPKQLEVDA